MKKPLFKKGIDSPATRTKKSRSLAMLGLSASVILSCVAPFDWLFGNSGKALALPFRGTAAQWTEYMKADQLNPYHPAGLVTLRSDGQLFLINKDSELIQYPGEIVYRFLYVPGFSDKIGSAMVLAMNAPGKEQEYVRLIKPSLQRIADYRKKQWRGERYSSGSVRLTESLKVTPCLLPRAEDGLVYGYMFE